MPYSCSICGKIGLKLWSDACNTFCICASCAEKRQIPIKYPVYKWMNKGNNFFAITIGTKKLKWKVNSRGKIPTSEGFDPYGDPISVTEHLPIKWKNKKIEVSPFLPYYFNYEEWLKLPTR